MPSRPKELYKLPRVHSARVFARRVIAKVMLFRAFGLNPVVFWICKRSASPVGGSV